MNTISLAGTNYAISAPTSFADREDLAAAFVAVKGNVRQARRVHSALVACCSPDAATFVHPHTLDSHDGDVSAFGAAAYEALRGAGASTQEIIAAAGDCFNLVVGSLYPRDEEVAKAEDFSLGEGKQTATP